MSNDDAVMLYCTHIFLIYAYIMLMFCLFYADAMIILCLLHI